MGPYGSTPAARALAIRSGQQAGAVFVERRRIEAVAEDDFMDMVIAVRRMRESCILEMVYDVLLWLGCMSVPGAIGSLVDFSSCH